jgi:hypothetical protein
MGYIPWDGLRDRGARATAFFLALEGALPCRGALEGVEDVAGSPEGGAEAFSLDGIGTESGGSIGCMREPCC